MFLDTDSGGIGSGHALTDTIDAVLCQRSSLTQYV